MDKIFFAKIKDGAKIPTKREEDGCYDLYACIDEDIIIPPHENALIPTGICSAFDPKYRIAYRERGSNTKFNGIVMAGQIDSGYRGEWFVPIYNGNDYKIFITNSVDKIRITPTMIEPCYPNNLNTFIMKVPTSKAICQFAIEEVPQVEIKEITKEEIDKMISERGVGKLGDSGK